MRYEIIYDMWGRYARPEFEHACARIPQRQQVSNGVAQDQARRTWSFGHGRRHNVSQTGPVRDCLRFELPSVEHKDAASTGAAGNAARRLAQVSSVRR